MSTSNKRSGWPSTSRHERGYGSEWYKLRKAILLRDCGICRCNQCKKAGTLLRATEVHHVVGKTEARRKGWSEERINHPSNLIAINTECHKRETAAEQGRTIKPKQEIGLDGWPIGG